MESSAERSPLAALEQSRLEMAAALRLPPRFYSLIGAAVCVQIATLAYGLAVGSSRSRVALMVGLVVFLGVATYELAAFRRLNGVWLGGLASRVVLGTSWEVSVAYAVGLAGAVWAALSGVWILAVMFSVIGGVGYAVCGRRWWRAYRAEPGEQAGSESLGWVLALAAWALAGLVVLLLLH